MKLQILSYWTFLCLSMLLTGTSLSAQPPGANIFVSSNLQSQVDYFNVENDVLTRSNFAPVATDADGIYYDLDNDILYQLNRSDNVINAYSTALENPTLTRTSISNFSNGREIAVVGDKLVISQDAAPSNGDQNRLLVFDISSAEVITFEKAFDVDINLWGIHADGSTLYAVVDNSGMVATFNNFFNQPAGALSPSSTVDVAGLVRTHGITYDPIDDIMILTDIGDAGSATDGALIVVRDFTPASADGTISAAEQTRVEGGSSQLGNPVDVAFDKEQNRLYVAERARNGGQFMCFNFPVLSGSIAPRFVEPLAGASAVNLQSINEMGLEDGLCDFVVAQTVALATGGTTTTIFVDDEDDFISFTSDFDPASDFDFTYVVTDDMGNILGIPPGNTVEFNAAGLGACNVYGLSFTGNLNIEVGDDLFSGDPLSDDCFELSTNNLTVNRIAPQPATASFFVSSNTQMNIGTFDVSGDNNTVTMSMFANAAPDADGIYYDDEADVIYQLNRTDNVINAFSNVSTNPTLTATSTDAAFTNGREIAVLDGKLVVSQDADPSNGDQNRFVLFDITPTSITFDRFFDVDINLWGIHLNGNTLFAVVDNSGDVAVFNDFFNNEPGPITPAMVASVEGLVRTHGITFDAEDGTMILTDIGDAGSATDGFLVVIRDYMDAAADGTVSADEQIRVGGGASQLGNPVDVALDKVNNTIYVAERARDGGKVLGFTFPVLSGGIAPFYSKLFAGASAINLQSAFEEVDPCDFVVAQTVALATGGTTTTIFVDDEDDFISFTSDFDPDANFDFTYVVTDDMGNILGIPPGNTVEFNAAGLGACNVYGLSFTGSLNIEVGDDLFSGDPLSDDCFELSTNNLTVNRIAPQPATASFFVSSNTQMNIGTFDVSGDNNTVTMSMFANAAPDADGIYYDDEADVIYQLNRTDNVINAYSNVSTNPTLTATSENTIFTNGREIAVVDGKLVVSQDANPSNGDQNRFVLFDITPTSITFDRFLNVDINTWGIHINGRDLFAVIDNSGDVAVFNNLFDNEPGLITPSSVASVEGLVRTHGITFDAEDGTMILTDIGDAGSANDGFLVIIEDYMAAAADGTVSADEQIRVGGASSQLGNPVDVALDKVNNTIYVAERATDGGKVLGFTFPVLSGGIAPFYSKLFAGASAINLPSANEVGLCDFVVAQTVALAAGGTTTTIFVDDEDDFISFTSDFDPDADFDFTYVVTDDMGNILGIPPGNTVEFNAAGLGACNVYGLSFTGNLSIAVGDNLFSGAPLSDDCFELSTNNLTVNRIAPQPITASFFVSSNTQMNIGAFDVSGDNTVTMSMFANAAADADGIYYDDEADVIYQLNRTDNVINAFSNVSTNPTLTATSDPVPDFTNGREIAVVDGKLVVSQDADPTNGDQNRFIIFDISPTSITLDRIFDADINLWGIHANGRDLFAVIDNSNQVALFENFFGQPAGPITPSSVASVEGLVRTHGITFDAEDDIMILTDIGDAGSANDGFLFVINDYMDAAADGTVSADELIRAGGASSQLGNPVDVALDKVNNIVYVAERATDGGKVLGFKFPNLTGGIAPIYSKLFAGASAINLPSANEVGLCDFVVAQTVALAAGGTTTTIFVDDEDDFISFTSNFDPDADFDFTYVVTDDMGNILGIPPGNTVEFNAAGLGACNVYGLSFTGNLSIAVGDNLFSGAPLSDDCFELSTNNLTVNRIAPQPITASFFVSSNTQMNIGAFDVSGDNTVTMSMFANAAADADGIYYDDEADVIYQLNRTDNVINAYSNVSTNPTLTATSENTIFTNGREIAVIDGKLIVSQDANPSNGDRNRFVIFDISPTSITFDRFLNVDINTWGIHINGADLFAVVDNSNQVALFNDIFDQPAGDLTPSAVVSIEGLVRTHGITFDAEDDIMILTDIGDAGSATDGFLFVINDYMDAAADGTVSTDELIRVGGGSSQLGNPVDVALDKVNNTIYVAERARDGGKVLGFTFPVLSGGIAPFYSKLFAGASAINLPSAASSTASITDNGNELPADIRSENASLSNTPSMTIGKMYPVPANDLLNVDITSVDAQNTTIQIFDVTGVLKYTQEISLTKGNNTVTLQVNDLNVGVHFVRIPGIAFNGNFIKTIR